MFLEPPPTHHHSCLHHVVVLLEGNATIKVKMNTCNDYSCLCERKRFGSSKISMI